MSDLEKEQLDSYITEEELFKSLSNLKSNKSPGSDGLTSEFYKHFWKIIKKPLIDSINYSLLQEELSDEQK